MGSVGEDDLGQMVIEYLESDSSNPRIVPTNSDACHNSPHSILQAILLEAKDIETEVLDKVKLYVGNIDQPSSLKKWVVMRLKMDGYEASLCKTSWASSSESKVFSSGHDYEFIDVMIPDKNTTSNTTNKKKKLPTRLIVDLDFRAQFEIARPTQAYQELTNTLPPVFVGSEEKVKKIVSLLCAAAKKSMKESGLDFPPWRRFKYMHSKWFSSNCKRVSRDDVILPQQ